MSALDLIGQRFGRLLVIKSLGVRSRTSRWWCVCDCGTEKEVRGAHLVRGVIQSCGCLRIEATKRSNTKHGHANVGKTGPTSAYRIWSHMKSRCLNKRCHAYRDYGGRGITICERWRNSFANFLADMGEPAPGLTIDRFPNNDGNYEPGNCRWATRTEQNNNSRANRVVEFQGRRQSVAMWARELGINAGTIDSRLQRGWSEELALSPPPRQGQMLP